MPVTISAFNYVERERLGLKDYADIADHVTFSNQAEYGDGQLDGEWYFIDDKPLPDGSRVIYFGSFGNDNAPSASMYTNAEIFDGADPDELAEFTLRAQEWEGKPEYIDEGFDETE